MNVGIHQLRCVVAVADHGHITRASASLFMTQPALSAQVRQVESSLGVALFRRHPRGVEPTAAGEAFLVHARACLHEFDAAIDASREAARGPQSSVTVGIIVGTQVEVISQVLQAFRAASPETRLELVEHTFDQPSAGLLTGDVDLAFVVLPMQTEGLDVLPLAQPPVVAAVPCDHPLADRADVSILELLEEPWVSADTADRLCRDYWLAVAYRKTAATTHHRVRTHDKFVQLVASGEAIGMAPSWITQAYHGRTVRFVPIRDVHPPTVALAWRSEDTSRPVVQVMAQAARTVTASRR